MASTDWMSTMMRAKQHCELLFLVNIAEVVAPLQITPAVWSAMACPQVMAQHVMSLHIT